MIKIPFSRTSKGGNDERSSLAFSEYCRDELEHRRDSDTDFDEERFKAAVDLAVSRLRAMEENEGKA